MSIRAIYENGVFKPLEDVPIKEGTEVDVYPRSDEKGTGGKPKKSITDFAFFGMWKDRDDIGTGAEYVARIRQYDEREAE
jgi:predicted DNA-binding antitoxin AbrB/MazE fold protein